MSTFNSNGGKCDSCGSNRSLRDGLCHECEQSERDSCPCVECNLSQSECSCDGGPFVPDGYRL